MAAQLTPEELEDLAFHGKPMPELTSQADEILYLSFRNLYDFAKRAGMNPEQGKQEKSQILDAHRRYKFGEEVIQSCVDLWKRIDVAASEYRKAPSVESADHLLEAIYGVRRKCFGEADEESIWTE